MTDTVKKLPDLVTHLDIIKTVAVVIMIIDHVGLYFLSDQEWLRAIGRVGMPVWFFMIGYAKGRDLPNPLLIGALILAVADFALFGKIFPFSALVTIIALRLAIDPVMEFITRSRYLFVICTVLLTLFYVVTEMAMEYGTMALLFAIAGYLTRHKDKVMEVSFVTQKDYVGFLVYIFVAFCLFQNAKFSFSDPQMAVMGILTAGVIAVLATMHPMTFPQIKDKSARFILQFCGRRTLDIYVAHLVAFKVILFVFLALN